MHEQSAISGYLCPDERTLRRYLIPVGGVIMICFGGVLWVEAFRNIDSLLHWLLAVGWSLLVAFLLVRSPSVIDNMQFSVEPGRVTNSCPSSGEVVLEVSRGLFVTTATVEFAYGKATTNKAFYLFSSKHFESDSVVVGGGLSALERLHKRGIVIVPKNKDTEAWIEAEMKIKVPVFPAYVLLDSKIREQGDGSLVSF